MQAEHNQGSETKLAVACLNKLDIQKAPLATIRMTGMLLPITDNNMNLDPWNRLPYYKFKVLNMKKRGFKIQKKFTAHAPHDNKKLTQFNHHYAAPC